MKVKPIRRWPWWIATALWTASIFFLSSQSELPRPGVAGWRVSDWLAHGGEYGVLALLWGLALGGAGARPLLAWTLALATGALDELYQGTVPGRHASFSDLAWDALGALLALAALELARRRRGPYRS